MSSFIGFREGCPATAKIGYRYGDGPVQVRALAQFEKEGKALPRVVGGNEEPDAIRVIPLDDDGGSECHDRVFTFNEQAAQAQIDRNDNHVPEGNVSVLNETQLTELNDACTSCSEITDQCPILRLVLQQQFPTHDL
jgi:hypothetical protein